MLKVRVLTVLTVLSVLATLLNANGGVQQPTFRSGVDLVHVDVVVVDKDGNPVRGLAQDAFTVRDRGKPQAIATFEEIAREPPAGSADLIPMLPSVRIEVASNRAPQSDRLVIMVVDDLHIWKGRTDRAKQIARDIVNRLGGESSMAVLFTSGDHNTTVTTDRSVLLGAVDTLKARQSWRRPHPAIDNQRVPGVDPEADTTARGGVLDRLSDAGKNVTAQDFFDNMQQYATLRNAARMLGGADVRRKAFVLLSEGIGKDLSGLFGSMTVQADVPQGGPAYESGNLVAFAASSMANFPPLHSLAVLEMMEALRRANVAAYAIDPRGAVNAGDLSSECFPAPSTGNDPCVDDSAGPNAWTSPVRQAQQGLVQTAVATGGFAVTNTDDFTGGLSRILEDLDHYYLLGFYPSDPNGKGYRPLNVRIAGHPDWTLRYRRGYMGGGSATPPVKPADPMMTLSASLLPVSDLPMRLTAIATPGSPGTTHMTLGLEVSAPLAMLQENDGRVRDTLNYEVLVVDEKKARVRSIGGLEGRLTLSPRASGQAPPATVVYELLHDVDIKPGRVEFRVSATSAKLARGGSAYLPVDVPDFQSAPIVLGSIALGYAEGARVPIAPPPQGPRSALAARTLPFPPTLDRVFAAADTLRIYLEGSARSSAGLVANLEVIDAQGKVVASHVPSVSSGGDRIRIAGVVPLHDLPPGAYLLRATGAAGGQKAVRETGFVIH